jgi:Fe-S cluster biogenesis protein NfuA
LSFCAVIASMFISFQITPNPDALKFLPQARLNLGEVLNIERSAGAMPPLAKALFELDSVLRVMLGGDFVTVTRHTAGEPWSSLKPQVLAVLASHLLAHPEPWAGGAEALAPTDAALEAEIRQVIGLYVRPGAQRDGGDITVERFDAATGVLHVRMEGACNGCPSSQLTLRASVETIVRRYVPEVTRVEHAAPEASTAMREPAWKKWFSRAAPSQPTGARPGPIFSHNGVPRADTR